MALPQRRWSVCGQNTVSDPGIDHHRSKLPGENGFALLRKLQQRRAGLFWDERGSGDQTRDLKLFEAAGDHKTARAGFVGNFEVRARMSFADSPEGFLQAVDIVGDGAE